MKIFLKVKSGKNILNASFEIFNAEGDLKCLEMRIDEEIQDSCSRRRYFLTNKKELIDLYNEAVILNTEKSNLSLI